MEPFEREISKCAIVIKINLPRATLNEALKFKDYLNEAILVSDVDIVVNLSDCGYLDSSFLGVLVSGYKRLKKKNRTMVIVEPSTQSSVFLTLSSIGKIFPLYRSVQSALEDIKNKKLLNGIVENLDNKIQPKEKYLQVERFPTKLNMVKFSESGLVTVEEVIPEIIDQNNLNSVDKVQKEENVKGPNPKPLYSDVNFREGSVEWAFGFN